MWIATGREPSLGRFCRHLPLEASCAAYQTADVRTKTESQCTRMIFQACVPSGQRVGRSEESGRRACETLLRNAGSRKHSIVMCCMAHTLDPRIRPISSISGSDSMTSFNLLNSSLPAVQRIGLQLGTSCPCKQQQFSVLPSLLDSSGSFIRSMGRTDPRGTPCIVGGLAFPLAPGFRIKADKMGEYGRS